MKKLFVILLSMGLVITASAQHYRPRTTVVLSGGYYPNYYYPYGYTFLGRPYYYRPSKLALEIDDIQSDYQDRIWAVRHDKSLSRTERKMRIHELKSQRDQAIRDAERNYYDSY
jgi:hypothetical protein